MTRFGEGIGLVALDIDGTTVRHDGSLSPRVREAVARAVESGREVVLATGRSLLSTLPMVAELGLRQGTAVCSNGAVTVAFGAGGVEIVRRRTFDPRGVVAALTRTWPEALVAVERVGVGFDVSAPFPEGLLEGEVRVVGVPGLASEPTTRVTVVDDSSPVDHFAERVERLGLHGVEYAVGYTSWVDITPENCSKATALQQVCEDRGIAATQVLAVGDQRNDIEMLRWAGTGIAMGHAPAEVVEAAGGRTGTVDEDGLVPVLEAVIRSERVR